MLSCIFFISAPYQIHSEAKGRYEAEKQNENNNKEQIAKDSRANQNSHFVPLRCLELTPWLGVTSTVQGFLSSPWLKLPHVCQPACKLIGKRVAPDLCFLLLLTEPSHLQGSHGLVRR